MSWTMTLRKVPRECTPRVMAPCRRQPAIVRGGRNIAVALADAVLGWAERSRQRRILGALGDDALRDIGISRADADRELSKPFWRT